MTAVGVRDSCRYYRRADRYRSYGSVTLYSATTSILSVARSSKLNNFSLPLFSRAKQELSIIPNFTRFSVRSLSSESVPYMYLRNRSFLEGTSHCKQRTPSDQRPPSCTSLCASDKSGIFFHYCRNACHSSRSRVSSSPFRAMSKTAEADRSPTTVPWDSYCLAGILEQSPVFYAVFLRLGFSNKRTIRSFNVEYATEYTTDTRV